MRLTRFAILAALFMGACESTPEKDDEGKIDGSMVNISPSDLEPAGEFIHRTKRMLVAEFVRVELTAQFYEGHLGIARDIEYVKRSNETLPDGTIVVKLKRIETGQKTNFDPDRLPRIYFGKGLEARAYNELHVYMRRRVDEKRPVHLSMVGVTSDGDSKLWVAGREQMVKPKISIESSLIWSESFEHYKHRSAIY
ncbi:MAG: hypothetical protein ACYTGZ_17730 [Planctomycetota bacterium]|jgi:hypothetical protein